MELVRRIDLVRETEHRVFEGQECPRIDVEFDVQVDRPATPVLGMKINFPRLSKRIRLHEMTLVVDVESVRHRMVLKVCDETSDINCGHCHSG
jgi:hypothetical protein